MIDALPKVQVLARAVGLAGLISSNSLDAGSIGRPELCGCLSARGSQKG